MEQIKLVFGKLLEPQESVFTALDFNLYDDEGIGSLDPEDMSQLQWIVSAMRESIFCGNVYRHC